MTQPSRILQEAVEGLARKCGNLASDPPVRRLGNRLRGIASKISGADRDTRREFLQGIDPSTETIHWFERNTPSNIPLKDSNGKVIGVKFLGEDDTPEPYVRWARAEDRRSDSIYTTGEPIDPESGTLSISNPTRAPWASDKPPAIVFAHSGPSGLTAIKVPRANAPSVELVVDGRTFGRILAANDHYRQAVEGNKPTVDARCNGAWSAPDVAKPVWQAGINTEWFAFKTTTCRWDSESDFPVSTSGLAAVADSPWEEIHLKNPITHLSPPAG